MDPRRSPQRVFLAHALDEITQATIDLRAPCPAPRLPAPECLEPSTMPAKDRRRRHHLGQVEKLGAKPPAPACAEVKDGRSLRECADRDRKTCGVSAMDKAFPVPREVARIA